MARRDQDAAASNLRTYGQAPHVIAVIHGGPGAGGEMAPVARELASDWGVLEPIQTATTLEGQVQELRTVLQNDGTLPIVLIGHSWGAWLAYMVAARYPALVKKLILVSSGPFEHHYVTRLSETRMSRLDEQERADWSSAIARLGDPSTRTEDKDTWLARLGELASKADAYDPVQRTPDTSDVAGPRGDIFDTVWAQAAEMRLSGALLTLAGQIRCPVVAIHGDYDPHPADGVQRPLSETLEDFCFLLLEKCGHTPWLERQAQDAFYTILRRECANVK